MAKAKTINRFFKVQLPRTGTTASRDYFASWQAINRFYSYVLSMAARIEVVAEKSHKVLVDIESSETKKNEMQRRWESRRSTVDELRDQRQFFMEIILVRHVENFLNYLASLLYEVFTQRPETLRSSDKIEVAHILKHDTIESIVREIAERKVESLSYASFDDVVNFFRDRFHVEVVEESELPVLKEAIELRNISVHNRCRINDRFISRTGIKDYKLGNTRQLFVDDLDRMVPLFASVAKRLDRSMKKKLKLTGIRFQNSK